MALSGLCMHSNTYDLKYPLIFSWSSRPFMCHKPDSILPLFPSENSKYPVHWFLTGAGHPKRLLSLCGCRQWEADWTWPWKPHCLSLFEWEGWIRWTPEIKSNFHDSMAILVACLSPLIYLSQQHHDLKAQPQQNCCLAISQGFYWLSEKTLIQQMIITHFVCIELEHKAAYTLEENTQSSSVKAFLFIHLFTCCLQTYEYHYKMNHVTVLCFKTLFPKEADGRDWQQLLKTFVSLCMYSKEWGLPKTQNRKGKTFPYYKVIMANFIKYHLFSFLVKQKTGEERKIIMKELHMLLEALAICQYKCFPIRRSRVLYLLQCIRSYFIKIQDPPPCLGVKHRNTQKYIAGIMGLGLVSFCRWNQLTSTCFAHVCHRLRVLHLQPMEKSSKPLSKLPHMNLAL